MLHNLIVGCLLAAPVVVLLVWIAFDPRLHKPRTTKGRS